MTHDSMQPECDQTVFDWIRRRREKLANSKTPDWDGNFVSHLLPPVFEAYAKILHRVEANYKNIESPLSLAEIALLKIPPCEPLKSFIEARRGHSLGNRVKWKELADLLNVPFAPEICHEWYRKKLNDTWCWPHLLSGPGDGKLDAEGCAELASLLKSFTDSEECFFRFSDIPFINSDEPKLFKGALNEVCGFLKGRYFGFEYWWPPDQSWCVCSDYDLQFTVAGGPRRLVSAIQASSVLECIEVTAETRVDVFAPIPPNPASDSPA
jgi:hypothetical protein